MTFNPLEIVAAFGSVSYGPLSPERLRALLLGEAAPEAGETARLRQAGAESDPNTLAALALSLGLTLAGLSARFEQLTGARLEEANPWMRGELY
ncbi:MAG TPA: hypothetical protein VK446_06395 [Methylocystis sp.]|nr:hypothetical protein [Methylocystis sp.]